MLMELTVAGVEAACKHTGQQVSEFKSVSMCELFLFFFNVPHVCLADLLFGVPGKYTGVSHYNRKRVVTYTITVVLSSYDAG